MMYSGTHRLEENLSNSVVASLLQGLSCGEGPFGFTRGVG